MNSLNYWQFINKTLELYSTEGKERALDFLINNKSKIAPPLKDFQDAQILNFEFCILAAVGSTGKAMEILSDAVLNKGYFYDSRQLSEDDDLEALRTLDAFKRILQICSERKTKAMSEAAYKIKKSSNDASKLFIALHGDQENLSVSQDIYEKISCLKEYQHLYIQAKNIDFTSAFCWGDSKNDLDIASDFISKEIRNISTIQEITLAGFSSGGGVAFHLINRGELSEVKIKLVLLAPWIKNIDELFIKMEAFNKTKVIIVVGELDGDCGECSQKLFEELHTVGIAAEYQKIPGLGHEYPPIIESFL